MKEVIETQVVIVDRENPDLAMIQVAADLIRAGELVAFPTETVYGLGANAFDAAAVAKIFAAKGRPASDPLIAHIYAIAQLEQITHTIPDIAWDLAQAFWPGPLTLVLPKRACIPDNVSAGLATVAVRMPNHRVPYHLLRLADVPIVAPSANLFSRPSPTTAQHVMDDLDGRVPLILDAGPADIGVESTVLDLTQPIPTILRPGGLPIEQLRKVVSAVTYSPKYAAMAGETMATPSPGMLIKHYAPNAEVLLFVGRRGKVLEAMRLATERRIAAGKTVGVLIADEDGEQFAETGATVTTLGSQADLPHIAQRLFAGMRALEHQGVDVIVTRTFDRHGLGLAIADRLIRATEGRVIEVDN
ncbi:threonylcarbamoyl-AMP synthase [bacterium]|nr:threonylcarbamoyl-AMP synthase [bacterium]